MYKCRAPIDYTYMVHLHTYIKQTPVRSSSFVSNSCGECYVNTLAHNREKAFNVGSCLDNMNVIAREDTHEIIMFV